MAATQRLLGKDRSLLVRQHGQRDQVGQQAEAAEDGEDDEDQARDERVDVPPSGQARTDSAGDLALRCPSHSEPAQPLEEDVDPAGTDRTSRARGTSRAGRAAGHRRVSRVSRHAPIVAGRRPALP